MKETSHVLAGKVILITGGTSGLGAETTKHLASLGATLCVVGYRADYGYDFCRTLIRQTGNPYIYYKRVDLRIQQKIYELADFVQQEYDRLDVLINNAGGIFGVYDVTSEGIEQSFALNHVAPFLLTALLLGLLKKTRYARIINVSSEAHHNVSSFSFDWYRSKEDYSGWGAYCQTKLANILFTYALARRLQGTDTLTHTLHPGFVATNIATAYRFVPSLVWWFLCLFAKSPQKGAQTTTFLASSDTALQSQGQYFIDCVPCSSSLLSYDQDLQERLWTFTLQNLKEPVNFP